MKTTQIKAIKGTRHDQMAHAEKGRKLLKAIEWELVLLQLLPNNELMTNKVLRLVLSTNEDIRNKWDNLNKRKEIVKRIIWVNA